MPELETLFVRIDADLSAFKRGLAEAKRETLGFANEARGTFATVGDALDLSQFRQELQKSETAVKESAERMKKAYAEVGKELEKATQRAMQNIARSPGGPTIVVPQSPGARPGQSPGPSKGGSSEIFSLDDALTGAGVASGLVTIATLMFMPPAGTTIAFILGSGVGAGFLTPLLERMAAGDGSGQPLSLDETIKDLDRQISKLEDKLARSDKRNDFTTRGGQELLLADLKAQRDALLELQRSSRDAAARSQEFFRAFAELSDCLRQLCARIDELAPLPEGAGDGLRPGRVGFDPHGSMDGGQVLRAAFGGPGADGLGRELADAGFRVQDLSTGFTELAEATGGYQARARALVLVLAQSNARYAEQSGLLGQLRAQVPELGGSFGAFLERTGREAETLNAAVGVLGQSFVSAFEGAIARGEDFGDVLKGLALDLAEIALRTAGNALLEGILGSIFAPSGPGPGAGPPVRLAQGAAFTPGGVMARNIKRYAQGGIVDTPEAFAFARGLGIMGEAGPEAILPLARLASGELGVKARIERLAEAPAPAAPVVINEFTIDARGADREGLREVMALIQVVRREGMETRRMIGPVALRTVLDSRRRGGSIARAFGAR